MNEEITLDAERVIAFRPEIARHLGSINAALLFQQLSYWADKGARSDGFIYKSAKEIEEETTLTTQQQRTARDILVESGWIEVKLIPVNNAPTMHFRPIVEITKSILQKQQKHLLKQQEHLLPATKAFVEIAKTIYEQENTTENTQDTPVEVPKKFGTSLSGGILDEGAGVHETPKHKQYDDGAMTGIKAVYDYYCELYHKNPKQFKLDEKRKASLNARLQNFTVDELTQAIYNASIDPFYSGQNDRGWAADLDYIIRNDANTEKLANRKVKKVIEYKERVV